jgi:hypothetical protein
MLRTVLAFTVALAVTSCSSSPKTSNGDVVLDPPPAGMGFQLGTPSFDVPAGTEVQKCYFFTVPGTGTAPIWISRTDATQNPGSHHFNVFRVKTVVNLNGNNGDLVDGGQCWISSNWADWPLVTNLQESSPGHNEVDWKLPDGVAYQFTPGEKLMLQIHYVNATTQQTPGKGKALVNFWNYTGSGTPMELGTVFATNQNIRICPGDMDVKFNTTCRFARTGPVTILGANGHFHSRGVEFDMNAVDANNNPMGSNFYTSMVWNDPPFNTALNVQVPQNGGVGWTCAYNYEKPAAACADPTKNNCTVSDGTCTDASSTCCISFGGHVEFQEHCNAFVYYYPKTDNASCF